MYWETWIPLRVHINEHLAGKRRCNVLTPLGKHGVEVHGNNYVIECKTDVRDREFITKSVRSVLDF